MNRPWMRAVGGLPLEPFAAPPRGFLEECVAKLEQAGRALGKNGKDGFPVVDVERDVWFVVGDGPRELRGRIELARLAKQAHEYERILMLHGKPREHDSRHRSTHLRGLGVVQAARAPRLVLPYKVRSLIFPSWWWIT